jgi:predicted Zn-dependent protease
VAARVVVAVAAVLLIAWLAVMERDERLLQRGGQTAGHARSAQDAARAEQAFRDARLFNPDSTPDLGRAFIYIGTGRRKQAIGVVDDVLRREPDNLTAWGLLFSVSRGVDPAGERRALAQRRRLDPLSARARP